jgi:hypothetical protein
MFTRQITALVADDDFAGFQVALLRDPEQSDLIEGGGGIRKVRLKLPGRGKSGGARVIYFWIKSADQIYMLLAYSKAVRTELTATQVKMLRELVKELE